MLLQSKTSWVGTPPEFIVDCSASECSVQYIATLDLKKKKHHALVKGLQIDLKILIFGGHPCNFFP